MPGTYDLDLWNKVESVRDFDTHFNCDWYGHATPEDFYTAINPKHLIPRIEVPTLIVNAENDPFLPEECFPIQEAAGNEKVTLEIPEMGGHVGFFTFSWNGIYWSESRTEAFFTETIH